MHRGTCIGNYWQLFVALNSACFLSELTCEWKNDGIQILILNLNLIVCPGLHKTNIAPENGWLEDEFPFGVVSGR